MSAPKPSDPLYRPVVFAEDYAKIGREVQANNPTLGLFDMPPEPAAIAGERAFTYERDRLEALAREAQGGYNSQEPWSRVDGPLTPGQQDQLQARAEERRALGGGLPDAPGAAQALESGNRLPVRWL